jgi:hypothetical protein
VLSFFKLKNFKIEWKKEGQKELHKKKRKMISTFCMHCHKLKQGLPSALISKGSLPFSKSKNTSSFRPKEHAYNKGLTINFS